MLQVNWPTGSLITAASLQGEKAYSDVMVDATFVLPYLSVVAKLFR